MRRPVGGPVVMRAQVQHLLQVAENMPDVTLRVLPHDRGAHGAMNGGFTLLDPGPPGKRVSSTQPADTTMRS
ncbi:Scr1 family TA system antitoxin-like transcriptional regulator [Streptomyces sp. NPDC079167]|uniref:Scr1 family TA system antitoxin-like transcriptional regulator n=1 Tax=Streptomyces sp. NPDC079167 TaxID=3154513 RepID=UPI0034151A3C